MLKANKTIKLLIQEIAQIRIELATLSKRESELKAELKGYMGSERLLVSDTHCVVIETRNRAYLDEEAIAHDMGIEFIQKYKSRTEYEVLSVKSIEKTG